MTRNKVTASPSHRWIQPRSRAGLILRFVVRFGRFVGRPCGTVAWLI